MERLVFVAAVLVLVGFRSEGAAETDWLQFRGPGARGQGPDLPVVLTWGDSTNVVWQRPLPGPGASSPVVHGGRGFLTYYTGYATSSREPGEISALQRHLVCVNLTDGTIRWDRAVAAEQPEQAKIREDHGYASSTPAMDEERIYVFYGRSGVLAYSHEGEVLWRSKVGDQLNGWGSATSPVLHGDLLLVNASVESQSLIALDRKTGKERWRAGGIKESWHAPALVVAPDGQTEIVVAMLRKLAGFASDTGALLWQVDTGINWYMCPTPVTEAGVVYSIGGRNPNGGLAVRAGGRGDVTASHVRWKINRGSNVPSPILHDGHLYFAHENLGVVYCVDATSGRLVYEERLDPSPGQIYASPVLAGGGIYYTGRGGRMVVVAARPKFEVLAVNTLESNRGVFNATPAFAGRRLLLRSNRALYCLGSAPGA